MTQTTEQWKPVVGFEDSYEVSDQGRIRSLERKVAYKDGRVAVFKASILRGSLGKNGYFVVALKTSTKAYLHRIVAETFLGKPESRITVNHINGIKTDNRLVNLEFCTYKENNDHARTTGLNAQYSTGCNLTKFPPELIKAALAVKAEYNPPLAKLAEMFGISISHLSGLLNGKTRKSG